MPSSAGPTDDRKADRPTMDARHAIRGNSVHATDHPRAFPNLDDRLCSVQVHGGHERGRVGRALDVLSGLNVTVAIDEVDAIQRQRHLGGPQGCEAPRT